MLRILIKGDMNTPHLSLTDLIGPAARTLLGFVTACLLAFLGDVVARALNLALGYPWSLSVHQNIQMVGVGLGAGFGAYLPWINLGRRWYVISGAVAIVLAAGVAGAYLGLLLGPGVDPTYWWGRFAMDSTVHLAAGGLSTFVATVLGLIDLKYTRSRLQSYAGPIDRGGISRAK